ncbi:MAG TPA: cytochrome P450 [Ilumatobacteraceae bacterium]|nr:cytochrome P450 [Ilumatobacteraceae bacterium]
MTDVSPRFFNPLQPGYTEDPYPHFAEMREHDPVHLTLLNQWLLFRYDDVSRILRDPSMSVSDEKIEVFDDKRLAMFEAAAGAEFERSTSMLNADPPDHTRLRRLVSKAFTPSSIEALRPRVQQLVDAMLDPMAELGTGDVVTELAFPLPFDVISEMLGMPDADKEQIAAWSGAVVKTLDPIISDDEIVAAIEGSRAMEAHIDQVIAWKRDHPADDLLSALIAAEEDGDRLSSVELRDQVVLLFIAGHETTVNLIGTGIYELLRHPDQLTLLRDDPSLDANAVDELLRFVSPVQLSRRVVLHDITIRGKTIPKGMFVLTGLASANRDPQKWGPTADELDIGREGAAQHVSFGSGIHYCLGASLARLEAQVAIGTFVRRFPNARVAAEPEWNGRINLRGLEHLPVAVD